MKLKSIVFVVTLIAGMLVIAAPPAAAQAACVDILGEANGIDGGDDRFEILDECADEFTADESITYSGRDGSATATASHQHSFIFEPDGHLSSADADGSVSASVELAPCPFCGSNVNARSQISFFPGPSEFEIPEGSTGSVFGSVTAETTGTDPGDSGGGIEARSELEVNGPVDHLAFVEIVEESPVTKTDSLGVSELSPGRYSVDARLFVDVNHPNADTSNAFGASADFDVTITVESVCDNEFTDGDDIITGTPDFDFLCGGDGNDSIEGLGGNDILVGGNGSDSLVGGDGLDTIEGGAGDDFIEGGPQRDIISGGPGNDGDFDFPVSGGDGNDVIDGDEGQDTIAGDLGEDELEGGSDTDEDIIRGCNLDVPLCSADQAELDAAGVSDEDTIRAGSGGSIISGGADEDTIDGGPGFDDIFGGPGNDLIDSAGGGDRIQGGPGGDFLIGGGGHESGTQEGVALGVFGGPGNDIMGGWGGDDLMEGGGGRDAMAGNEGSDKLRGQGDNDCLVGGTRKDVLAGGGGNDRLIANDGVHDVVNGGPNFDRARVDGADRLIRVENDNFQGQCV